MPIVGGLDIHRKRITFDYLDTVIGQVCRGQVSPIDRVHLRAWLARFTGCGDVAFAVEGCTGWRYVAEELAAVGVTAHLAEPADTAFARGRKRHAKTDPTPGTRSARSRSGAGRPPARACHVRMPLRCRRSRGLSGGGGGFSAARRLAASISATLSRWCARFSVCSRAI